MAGYEPEEPEFSDDSEYCQAVRIGRHDKGAELTIFHTPNEGYQIHNGYLAEQKTLYSHGRRYDKLTIVTSRGKKIVVRRYEDDEEFKMYGHRPWEPVYTSGEAVRVGRGPSYLDVIIRYNNPGFGRGEFSVDRGRILNQQPVNGGRTLRIQTYSGHDFQITRLRGGEYVMETYGYWCTKI